MATPVNTGNSSVSQPRDTRKEVVMTVEYPQQDKRWTEPRVTFRVNNLLVVSKIFNPECLESLQIAERWATSIFLKILNLEMHPFDKYKINEYLFRTALNEITTLIKKKESAKEIDELSNAIINILEKEQNLDNS